MTQSPAHYPSLVASSSEAIISTTLDWTIVTWNAVAERLFGYREAEVVGKNISLLIPSDWRQDDVPENYHEMAERLRRGESIEAYETIRVRKDGRRIDVSVSISHVRQSDVTLRTGEADASDNKLPHAGIRAFVLNFKELSASQGADELLRDSEKKLQQKTRILQSILDNINDGVVVADELGNFLLFNPEAEQILRQGLTDARPEEWSARYGIFLPDGTFPFPPAELPLARALRGEVCEDVEMLVNHGQPSEARLIRVTARPMYDEAGIQRGGIAIFRDITEKKRSENLLRTSEARYRTLIEATAAIVWNSPASGEFDSVQPGWTAFTGQTVEQHRGWGWLNPIHPDDRETSARAWAAAVNERGTYQVEHRLRRADGEYRYMFVRAVPIFESDGAIREWVGVHTDVTDQKRIENERAELLARLTIQIERMPLAFLLSGPDFRFIQWNPAAERIFGFSASEVLGKHPFESIVPAQSKDIVDTIFDRLAQGDMNAHGTLENVTKEGRKIICEWHNTPLFAADGTFQGIFSLAQDVTTRQRAEQEVRDTQNRLRHVLASSPAVLFILNIVDERITGINWISDNVQEILGYSPEEALAPHWWMDRIHPNGREELIAKTSVELFEKGTMAHEYRFRHADGEYRWTRSDVRLVRNDRGVPVEAVGAWADVTSRKILEDQFRQAQKMDAFGQLAGGVAHDFNNILTIINGYCFLLLQSLPQNDSSRELIVEIHKAGERSAGLTRQLLAFSRQQVLATRILNLNEVVAETEEMLRRMIGEDISVTTKLDPKLWPVRADQGQCEQLLLNLTVNARDAMPIGGRLTIETKNIELNEAYCSSRKDASPGSYVLLSVKDTGCGIAPEVMDKIFEPFFTTKERGRGTGLGLATVYGIVKQSGGHISVDSEVGVGTTFNVYLPKVEQPSKDVKAPSQARTPPRGTETVLLAEDESGVRALTKRILERSGYQVIEAADGTEAMQKAANYDGPIHLLITDVVMPGVGGRALVEQLIQRNPKIRVIFMSGYTDDAVIRHGVMREGVVFLQKPFTPIALATTVRNALDHP